jgi:hypothetical protein
MVSMEIRIVVDSLDLPMGVLQNETAGSDPAPAQVPFVGRPVIRLPLHRPDLGEPHAVARRVAESGVDPVRTLLRLFGELHTAGGQLLI